MRLYRDGTLACTAGSVALVGTGTAFTTNVAIGDMLLLGSGVCLEVVSVDDDTNLKVDIAPTASASGLGYVALRFVTSSQYRDLTVKIEQFLTDRQTSLAEFNTWVNGTKTGGPNGDGKYPLTDRFGNVFMCRCPAVLDGVADSILDEFADLKEQVAELMANPSGYVLPQATDVVLGGVKIGTGLSIDVNGILSIANGGAGGWATTRTYTTTVSSGTTAIETQQTTMSPALDATNTVVIGNRNEVIVNLSKNWASSGYPVTTETVMSTAGTGTIGKLVTHMVQMNLTNAHVGAALGFEAVLSAIGSTTTIGAVVGFMFPNARVVPNIGNVTRVVAFLNQDTDAQIQTYGPIVNADLVEHAPPAHPGIQTGRYYTAPYETLTTGTLEVGKVYLVPVLVPHRLSVSKLGMNVISGQGQTVTARLALYQTSKGQASAVKVQTDDIPITNSGIVNYPVVQRIDPGTYFLTVEVSSPLVVTFAAGAVAHMGAQAGQTDPLASGADLMTNFTCDGQTYGVLPAYLPSVSISKGPNRPHLWYQA